jgi:cobalt-zinc-cadmium efflux system outer membrane protein
VLYLQSLVARHEEIAELAERLVEVQRERFKIAKAKYRGVVQAELAAHEVELARRDAATRLDRARVRLGLAMGATGETQPVMRGQPAVKRQDFAPLEQVLARARQVAPELAQSQAAIETARWQVELERWNAVPDLNLGPRVRNSLSGNDENAVGARLAVDLPLFDKNQGRIAESAAEVRRRHAVYDLVQVQTLGDVTAQYAEIQDVQSRWEYYRAEVRPLIRQTKEAIRESLEDNTVEAYELTRMLESLANMELKDLENRYQHQRLRTRLEIFLECPLRDLGGGAVSESSPHALTTSVPGRSRARS